MSNICVVCDGDIYGYIFCLCMLKKHRNKTIHLYKLEDNKNLKRQSYIKRNLIDYLSLNDLDLTKEMHRLSATINFNYSLTNLFKQQDTTYLTNELFDKNITKNKINFILTYIKSYKDKNVFNSVYPSIVLCENDIFPVFDDKELNFDYNINVDIDLFKKILLDKCIEYENFKFLEVDKKDIKKLKYDFYIDNTYENLLSNKSSFISSEIFKFNIVQEKIKYKNIETELKNYNQFIFDEHTAKEIIPCYDYLIVNHYNFSEEKKSNCINNKLCNNNIFNIGISYLNYDFSFGYSVIIDLYILDMIINIFSENDFRASKIRAIEQKANYIFNLINNLIENIFLYSMRNDSYFWSKFNTVEYLDYTQKKNNNFNSLTNNNFILELIKNMFFNIDNNVKPDRYNYKLIYNLLMNYQNISDTLNRYSSNQYRYLKNYVY